jgi:hypothetical protein
MRFSCGPPWRKCDVMAECVEGRLKGCATVICADGSVESYVTALRHDPLAGAVGWNLGWKRLLLPLTY